MGVRNAYFQYIVIIMKLQEFFNAQKNIRFTDIDKLDLYQGILYKKTQRPSLKRSSFIHAKYFIYTMVFVVLILGVYGVYFMDMRNFQDYNRFAVTSPSTNTVQADYIAQVIEGKGNFFIEHNWVLTTTNNIGNGDTILLKEGAQLVFEIDSGTQSKIIGPAKLIIQNTTPGNYKLNLIYGNYIQMEGDKNSKQNIELAINDITIKQQDKTQQLNFRFIKNGKNQIFQNNGANILVTQNNDENKSTTITKEQVINIQDNDIKIFANISNFTQAIQEKNISQTFSLVSGNMDFWSGEETILLSLLQTAQTREIKDDITKEIAHEYIDEKKILDPEYDEQVNSSLSIEGITQEFKTIEEGFVAGDVKIFETAFSKLEKRILTVYQSFSTDYTKTAGDPTQRMKTLQWSITTIQNTITTSYSVPPKYIDNLQYISKSITEILKKGYGSAPVNTWENK